MWIECTFNAHWVPSADAPLVTGTCMIIIVNYAPTYIYHVYTYMYKWDEFEPSSSRPVKKMLGRKLATSLET